MINDPIANLLIAIKNGVAAGKSEISVPASTLKQAICEVLQKNQFITGFKSKEKKGQRIILINLKNDDEIRNIRYVKRLSKPGRRLYTRVNAIPKPKSGTGIILLSTPKGIMTSFEARKANTGGELIAEVA